MRALKTVLIIALLACVSFAHPGEDLGLRVLFIGNSLTYTNDLPEIVKALAKSKKQKFAYKMIALPNYGLLDHWEHKDTRKAIEKGAWDYVVLQQGPSSLPESRAQLMRYVKLFDAEIKAAGAKTAVYMVWPDASRLKFFPDVVESHRLAADEVKATLIPAGYAWMLAWQKDRALKLYGEDGFHPSPMGSYLAGLVMYQKFFEKSPVGLPRKLNVNSLQNGRIEVSEKEASVLQAAAADANSGHQL